MKITLWPETSPTRDGMPMQRNPKFWPIEYWSALYGILSDHETMICYREMKILNGFEKIHVPTIKEAESAMRWSDFVISVDSYPIHLANSLMVPAVAIWQITDPETYGYHHHWNVTPANHQPREGRKKWMAFYSHEWEACNIPTLFEVHEVVQEAIQSLDQGKSFRSDS